MAVIVSEGGWMWAAKRHVSLAWVVVGRERGCGRRNASLRRLSNVPVVTKNEFGSCEIEIAEGVVISTPSATHLTGLSYCSHTLLHPPRSLET